MDTNWISQFGAYNLVDIQKRVIPKVNTALQQPVEIIRNQISLRPIHAYDIRVLPQAFLKGYEVVCNFHPANDSVFMNWRTGRDVRYR